MNIYNILKLKRPVNYGKITLMQPHNKRDYHMLTDLKKQIVKYLTVRRPNLIV